MKARDGRVGRGRRRCASSARCLRRGGDVGLGPTSQAPPSPRFEGPYTLTFELSAACGDLAGLRYEWDLQGTQGESAALLTLPDGDPSELPTQR